MVSFLWKDEPRELAGREDVGEWGKTGVRETHSWRGFLRD